MHTTQWAVLGPGRISTDFVEGLRHSAFGALHAVGSSSPERARAFADAQGATVAGTYDDVLTRDDIDAVYIGTVHTTHAELAIRALEAGKAVLCEKPATTSAADTARVLEVAARTGRPFVEAYKNLFGPFADELRRVVSHGEIGSIVSVDSGRGFESPVREGRLFDPALAGGAILDIGCYPLSLVALVAFAASDGKVASPRLVGASGELVSGIDGSAQASLQFGEFEATVRCSVIEHLSPIARIVGTDGLVEIADPWGSRVVGATSMLVRDAHGADRGIEVPSVQPMAAEADAVSLALAEGRVEAPEVPWALTQFIADSIELWLDAVNPERTR